jgi:hypothetical protein
MAWQDPQGESDWRDAYGRYGQQGQDPYAQNPHGQDPYAQDPYAQNPYAQNPYAQNPYGQDPYAQNSFPQDPYAQYSYGGYGPPGVAQTGGNGAAVAALVANIVSAVLCCAGLVWIPGVIISAVALSRVNTNPESARRLTIVAWVCVAADVVLCFVALILLGVLSGDSSSTTP